VSVAARILVLVAALLTLAVAVQVTRLLDVVARPLRFEIASQPSVTVPAEARQRLASLEHDVVITYFVSPAADMPSHMRHLRRDVREIVESMASHAGGRIHINIVDPSGDETLEILAARHRAAPFRVRTITRDGHDERTVWSSITIASGPHPVAVINGVEPDLLPDLRSLILRHVEFMSAPRAPVFAVAAAGGASALAAALSRYGEVREVDLDRAVAEGGSRFPTRADILIWLDPRDITPERLREIEQFVESGRMMVVAGSRYRPLARDGGIAFEPLPYGLETLLAEFGLTSARGVVADRLSMRGGFAGVPVREYPFLVRCIAANQDFSRMRMSVNGNVVFESPSTFSPVGEVRGWRIETLMSTSDGATLHHPPARAIGPGEIDASFSPESGTLLARQPLALRVRPEAAGAGELIVLAASTPLRDEWLMVDNAAHQRLLLSLLQTGASPERLVQIDARRRSPELKSELSVWKRLAWRIFVLLGVSGVLVVIAWRRGNFEGWIVAVRRGSSRSGPPRPKGHRRWDPRPAGAVGCVLAVLVAGAYVRGGADLTESGVNRVPPELVALLRDLTERGGVEADVILTDPAGMPPRLRVPARRVRQLMSDLARTNRDVSVRRIRPERLSPAEVDALAEIGVTPIEVIDRDEEVVSVRRIHASIVLRAGDATEVVRFAGESAFQDAPLRLGLAFRALAAGGRSHVAVASDVPRLTPAEAHELYQRQGLTAPTGTDVYARARRLLEESGFRVTHVVPSDPSVPGDIDAIVWLQPRRPAGPMLEAFTDALSRGVPGMMAVQHFNMQARQYPGRGYSIVYWPQPQFPEVDRLWLSRLGIQLPRVVFHDEQMLALPAESQVYRGDQREVREQSSALPFLVRAVRDYFDTTQPAVAGVGDLAMPWASVIDVDDETLATWNLSAHPFIASSTRTWTYAWSGGFIPPEVLSRTDSTGESIPYEGRRILAMRIDGHFPAFVLPPPGTPPDQQADRPLTPSDHATTLLLFGCSEMFKDDRIGDREYPADHLLVSSVVQLLDDPVLAQIASRRVMSRGFEAVASRERIVWRVVVLLAVPVGLLLVGAVRAVLMRRPGHVSVGREQVA